MKSRLLVMGVVAALIAMGCVSTKKATAAPVAVQPGEKYSDYEPDTQPWLLGKTWAEIDGVIYGAKPNELGPIGGAFGYQKTVTGGDFVATTVQGVMDALAKAKPGQTVFIPGNAVLDMTTWIVADKKTLDVPAGVTLASDRGTSGSFGALIFSDELNTRPMIRVRGDGARITGLACAAPTRSCRSISSALLRQGRRRPHALLQAAQQRRDPDDGFGLEVDNCEIMGWSSGGVSLEGGKDHHVHHNYIHITGATGSATAS